MEEFVERNGLLGQQFSMRRTRIRLLPRSPPDA
jgi:hypothetical protein